MEAGLSEKPDCSQRSGDCADACDADGFDCAGRRALVLSFRIRVPIWSLRSYGVTVHRPPGTGSFFGPLDGRAASARRGRKMCLSPCGPWSLRSCGHLQGQEGCSMRRICVVCITFVMATVFMTEAVWASKISDRKCARRARHCAKCCESPGCEPDAEPSAPQATPAAAVPKSAAPATSAERPYLPPAATPAKPPAAPPVTPLPPPVEKPALVKPIEKPATIPPRRARTPFAMHLRKP